MQELVATIDVGTNTAHLLLALARPDGTIVPVHTETRYVRLGQGVDASGELHPDALARLKTTLIDFARMARRAGAAHVRAAGTSASRDITDREGLVRFVREHAGIQYEIMSGEDEALLTSLGAVGCLDLAAEVNTVVVDIGGGSTELAYTRRTDGSVSLAALASINVGSVRLTERCFHSLPPTDDEVLKAERIVRDSLMGAHRPEDGTWMMVGAAGTIRALALIAGGEATEAAPSASGGSLLSRDIVRQWKQRLLGLDFEQTLAVNPEVLRGRADVMAAGVVILDAVVEYLGATECIVSPWGLRHGMAIKYARQRAGRES